MRKHRIGQGLGAEPLFECQRQRGDQLRGVHAGDLRPQQAGVMAIEHQFDEPLRLGVDLRPRIFGVVVAHHGHGVGAQRCFGLRCGLSCMSQFGLGEHRHGHGVKGHAIHRLPARGDAVRSHQALPHGGMEQHAASIDISRRPHLRVGRAQGVVHFDMPALHRQTEVLHAFGQHGHAAGGHEHGVALQAALAAALLVAHVIAIAIARDAQHLRGEFDAHALRQTGVQKRRQLGIEPGQHLRRIFENAALSPEGLQHRRRLHPDVAAADDDEVLRQRQIGAEAKQIVRSQRQIGPEYGQARGRRAGAEDQLAKADFARTAAIASIDARAIGRDDHAAPLHEGDAARGDLARMLLVAGVLHAILVRQHRAPVHRGLAAAQTEAVEFVCQTAHQRRLAHRLRRHATFGQTVAAEIADRIDHQHRPPGLGEKKGPWIPCATGAEHEHIHVVAQGGQRG